MFETAAGDAASGVCAAADLAWLDNAWPDDPQLDHILPDPLRPGADPDGVPVVCEPSGWWAFELDQHTARPATLSDAELIDGIAAFERVASWAQARQAGLLAEFGRRRPADDPAAGRSGTPSTCSEFAADEVGLALRLSRVAATARLARATMLVDHLPATLAAWQRGSLDGPKARAVTEAAQVLPVDQCAALEARVLPRAGRQTVAQLRSALARAVLRIDPAGAHDRYQRRRADRRVAVSAEGDGMASLWALLPAPGATAAYQRLTHLARGLGAADHRGMDARRADLLVDLLTGARCAAAAAVVAESGHPSSRADAVGTAAIPAEPGHPSPRASAEAGAGGGHDCRPTGPGRPLVHVVVPITMLMGLGDEPGELIGHGPIPAAQAREAAAGGTWRRLLTDPASGVLLHHDRRVYTPPVGLADFVRARDVHCRFPTCRQPAARADLDHTVAYVDGGTTSADNLHASCRHHHRAKTHGRGWRVHQHDDGRITYTMPTGHRYTSEPHDYHPDPPPDRPLVRPADHTHDRPPDRCALAPTRQPLP